MKNIKEQISNKKRYSLSRSLFIPFFSFLFTLFICSCPSPLTQPSSEKLPKGFGSFSLSVNTPRTILPEVAKSDFAVYTLAFTATGGGADTTEDRTNATLATTPVILAVGTYSLTVSAYMDTDKTRLAAQGTETGIAIADGANVTRPVTLNLLMSGGQGTFKWSVNISASGVTGAVMAITQNGASISGGSVTLNTSGATTDSRTLNSGKYNVSFTLKKDGEKREAVWNEILYVYNELTSNFPFTFDDNFFYRTHYTVTLKYDNGDADDPQSVMHGSTLTSPVPSTKPGYTFIGWYTDSGLTVPYDFSEQVYSDFPLYAKWEYDLYSAVAAFAGYNENNNMIIEVPHNITLNNGNITIPANSGRTLTITSKPGATYTISRGQADTTANNGLFIVPNNANLVFENIIIDGNKITYTTNTASLVRVDGGEFTLEDGAILRNNRSSSGGGVYVNSGTFTMNNGDITGNTATSSGGGVYVTGGGTFTMNNGEITGNTATSSGGGVCVYYSSGSTSTFTMNGGKIYNNNSSSTGGGVYVYLSNVFDLIDGDIFENTGSNGGGVYNSSSRFTMSGGKIRDNNAANGGGVYNYVSSSSSTYYFNMNDGEISGNTATTNGGGVYNYSGAIFTMSGGGIRSNNAANGGGVYNDSTFNMRGGEIIGNTVTSNGGGVYNNRTFTVGGASKINSNKNSGIANNVYIADYHFINLGTGSYIPTNGMEIYINANGGIGNIVVFGGAQSSDTGYFKTDDPSKSVLFDSTNGYIYIDTFSLTYDQLDFYRQVAAYAYADDNVTITRYADLILPIPVSVPANSAGKTLTIKSNAASCTLKRGFSAAVSSDGLFIMGSSNTRLIFENIIIDGDKGNYTTNTSPLVQVNGGTFTIGNGAVLQNNRSNNGGGVYISGTFIMNGGEITDNTATSNGGGVYFSSGTFTMNGGKIYSNNSSSNGGGVYNNSTFTMNNGEISGNTASSGGGVYNNSTFTMTSGKITENTASSNGGGVYVYYNGTFNMSGGKITGNKAATNGGGVYTQYYTYTNPNTGVTNTYSYKFRLGGTAVIKENVKTGDSSKNNVYLYSGGDNITIGNGTTTTGNVPAPASGMEAYINFPATTGGVIVSSGAAATDAAYFHTDDADKTVAYQAAGRLVVAAANPGEITAITFDINDAAPPVSGVSGDIKIYRSANDATRPASVTLTATGGSDYRWYWNDNLLSSAASVTLSADNPLYGKLTGKKLLTLEATVGGKPYNRTITFRVEP